MPKSKNISNDSLVFNGTDYIKIRKKIDNFAVDYQKWFATCEVLTEKLLKKYKSRDNEKNIKKSLYVSGELLKKAMELIKTLQTKEAPSQFDNRVMELNMKSFARLQVAMFMASIFDMIKSELGEESLKKIVSVLPPKMKNLWDNIGDYVNVEKNMKLMKQELKYIDEPDKSATKTY